MRAQGPSLLTDAQLASEIARCEYCAAKPCRDACPADCSPADFIMAARGGAPSDYRRAAALIMAANPLGGVCGAVCPDTHCMRACARATFDSPVNIPAVQATIIDKARELAAMPTFAHPVRSGRRVAVVGGGPAGYGAAAVLAQEGVGVAILEANRPGGMAALIPGFRLAAAILSSDLDFVVSLGAVEVAVRRVNEPRALLAEGYDAVVVTTGLDQPVLLGIPGEELAVPWPAYLAAPESFPVAGRRVAVIGGGAVAVDCAETAVAAGATSVEMFALETLAEMPLTAAERAALLRARVEVGGRVRVTAIRHRKDEIVGLETVRVALPAGAVFHPSRVMDVEDTVQARPGFDVVIVAAGARAGIDARTGTEGVFVAGDAVLGPTTVVEAVAAGKNAALDVLAHLGMKRGQWPLTGGQSRVRPQACTEHGSDHESSTTGHAGSQSRVKSTVILRGFQPLPVPVDAEFFGRPILSPFLLSAGPPTDGYEQMRRAYEAGWAGAVMKTAFDAMPIHIPSRYMFAFDRSTFGNCDNVSGHPLDRVCLEVERLRREFPDRLTLASTGGPVTGVDEEDRKAWQSNTAKLEGAGVCGIEFSLSCPQGGDGTKGDIVSQDAELTAKIVGWVLDAGDPAVPKLFKLTAAVTSIVPVVTAVKQVLARHAGAQAGVTLANTFPTLAFRRGAKESWEEGIVVGMSGAGVTPISNLTLANVSHLGVVVSGNGGPMDYRSAANFLALGARTVQFCSIVMKYGVEIVDELHSGLSHMLAGMGLASVEALIGRALPQPITPFDRLPAAKQISAVDAHLCVHCGNCTRCPYFAIALGDDAVPATDPARCIGCSFCTLLCFTGALSMRDRTPAEAAALREV
jgi:NADPH-dependent glutamate synthase beta subunit-like oxidoreductase/dihydroorotate dehydrogenase/Pyruvate/2-oxoacid:ferredoxin oxidoreductase delta subunit